MKYTTTRLTLGLVDRWRIHERTIANMGWGAIFVVFLLLIHSMLRPIDAPAQEALKLQPVIMFMTTTPQPPLPTYTPLPTLAPVVQFVEVPAPAPPPVVQFVEVPVQVPVYIEVQAPAQAVDTPAPLVEQPACDERCKAIQGRLANEHVQP